MSNELTRFFDLQLSQWPETQQRYRDLENVQTKELRTGELTLMAQFNPARIRSTGASITKQALAERPCFLCKENRPKEQLGLPLTPSDWRGNVTPLALAVEASPCWGRLEGALVNPFPILPMHFTLPTLEHQPQRIKPLFGQMLQRSAMRCISTRSRPSAGRNHRRIAFAKGMDKADEEPENHRSA